MDSLFEPFPFIGSIDTYKQSFIDEVNKISTCNDVIIDKIKEQAKLIEDSYPSLAQTFDNLQVKIREDLDAKCKDNNKFVMMPIIANEKNYSNSTNIPDINLIHPDQLFNFLQQYFTTLQPEQYPYLLRYGLSPSTYPLAKLTIISKLAGQQTKFNIAEEVKQEIFLEDRSETNSNESAKIFTRIRKIPNHSIENWTNSNEITNLIHKSPNHTIYINSSTSLYVVFDNSQGRCIINVDKQEYKINQGNFQKISNIIDDKYQIKSAAIIDGCLTFVLINNNEVEILAFKNDKIPDTRGMGEYIDTRIKTAYSGTCIHIINDKLHIYTDENEIDIFDLRNMAIVYESPQYYIFTTANFSADEIFGIGFTDDTLIVDIRKREKCEDYLTIIRPCFVTESLLTVSLIVDDILMEVTNSLISIIKTGKAQCVYAANPTQHTEYILNIIMELNNSQINNDILNFLNLMLDRLLILNIRQIYTSNKRIIDRDQDIIVSFFGKQLPIRPIRETYDMMIKSVKYGIYWPSFVSRILDKDYFRIKLENSSINDILNLPQSIFFPWMNLKIYVENSNKFANFIIEKIYDMYAIVKYIGSTAKRYLDKELVPFINFVFGMHRKQGSEIYAPVLKAMLSVLSVIPLPHCLAQCVIKNLDEISDKLAKYIKLDHNFANLFMNYLLNYGESKDKQVIQTPTSISLNTTVFAPENVCGDIETYFASPFRKIKVTQKDFVEGQINQNVFFNCEELSSKNATTEINGDIVSIDIIGNNKSTQYLLEGIVTKINCDDFKDVDVTYALFPFLYLRVARSSRKAIELSEIEKNYAKIINLPPINDIDEKHQTFRSDLRSIVTEAETEHEKPDSLFSIIEKATTQKNQRKNRKFNFEIKILAVKVMLSIIWSCNLIEEFNYFVNNPTIETFDAKFPEYPKEVVKIKKKLIEKLKSTEFEGMKRSINKKYGHIMNSSFVVNPEPKTRDERFQDIIKYYDFNLDIIKLKDIEDNKSFREEFPVQVNKMILKLFEKLQSLRNVPFAIPFARSLVQQLDFIVYEDNQVKNDFLTKFRKFNDVVINCHMIGKEYDRDIIYNLIDSISSKFSQQYSDLLSELNQAIKTLGGMSIAINSIKRCQDSITMYGKDIIDYVYSSISYAAQNTTRDYWKISEDICKLRTKEKNIVERIIGKDDDISVGAMIVLGAEIFDSEVTRYIKIQGKTELAIMHNIEIQRNSQACFSVDPPSFTVNDELVNRMKTFINEINLDQIKPPNNTTGKPTEESQQIVAKIIQHCIVLSFLTKLFDRVSDKTAFANEFPKMKEFCTKYQNSNVPNYSNSKYSFIIRKQLLRYVENKGKKDRFIPLTHCSSCSDSIIKGSSETSSFFVHTKMIDSNSSIEIHFNEMKTQLKYIGFISENWDCTFLSLLDRNIYMDKTFAPYTGSLSNITLWMEGNYLCFGNVKINTGESKKRWVFIITVCDDSPINYKFETNRSKSLKANEPPTKQHNFDIQEIFPKVCLGKQVIINGHSDVNITRLEDNFCYTIEGCSFEYRKTNAYIVPASQITTQYTPFDSVMICAETENKIGDEKQLFVDLVNTCKNYSISLIGSMMPYYLPMIKCENALNMIMKLSDTSSKQDVDNIKELLKGKENEVRDKLEETAMKGERDSSFVTGRDINQLHNSQYGESQIGIFQAWNHGIFYEKTFIQGLKLFFKFSKVCLGFIPMILKTFDRSIPNDLESAKMILNFFNCPKYESYFSNMSEQNYTEYFNKLCTYIFERDPKTIVNKQAHSSLINRCAQSLIGNLLTICQNPNNKEKRMPPLLIFSDRGASFSKCIFNNNNYYPVEILLPNGTTKVIEPNSYSRCETNKGYRYHFGTDGNKVLADWKSFINKDFSGLYKPLLVNYMLKNKICDTNISDYPPIVLFFANICISTMTEISDDYFDYKTSELDEIDNYFNNDNNIKVGYLNNFRDWANEGLIGYLKIDINRTHSRGVDYDSQNLLKIIDHLTNFPSKIIAFREKTNKLMYYVEYEGSTGQDVGGMFRDSYNHMVNELMDVNIRYFIKPPNSLYCEKNRLVPAPNLPLNVARKVGSVIASAIATRNSHKAWNLARFIWDSFVTDAQLSLLVDCDDKGYFQNLEKIVNEMRSGFWKVIPLNMIKKFSGRFIEGITCGVKKDLDYNTFLGYFDGPSRNCTVWPVFSQAIAQFTHQQFSKLMGFITGNETPKNSKDFCLKLRDKSPNGSDEKCFPLPFAHTCFNLIELMPYKTPELLRTKLIISFSSQSDFED